MKITSTGWWGIPGQKDGGRNSRVHAVSDGKPICGQKFHPEAEYQWCCDGLNRDYLECEKCKRIIDRVVPPGEMLRLLRDDARSLAELTRRSKDPFIRERTEALIRTIKESERTVKPIGLCTTIT